jgi:vacuolar-type H+-ATPase catalytic subunit A/Vma1
MLKALMDFYHHAQAALEAKIPLDQVLALSAVADIARMREFPAETAEKEIRSLMDRVQFSFADLGVE